MHTRVPVREKNDTVERTFYMHLADALSESAFNILEIEPV